MYEAKREQWAKTRQAVLTRDGFRCVACHEEVASADADIHHLLPRSMGGGNEPSNLVTLCDGCHAAHHPNLAGGLARRVIERWAVRLARWLDTEGMIPPDGVSFGPALRLFGIDRFREGQLPIVMAALAGKSILVVSPTGSGKSLCFQLPAVLRPEPTIVISPLKALMSEQVSDLLRKKIPATFINSDLGHEEKTLRYRLLGRNAIKLLHVAPERFFIRGEAERERIRAIRPSFLVVDEAHCVDQWGRDFRPEYGKLGIVRRGLGSPPVLAFTATAGREMQQRILESLGIPDAKIFVRGVDRPNIALLRVKNPKGGRTKFIADLLTMPNVVDKKVMVFVPSTKVGTALQEALREKGLEIPLYHSKWGTPWQRQELAKRFLGQSLPGVDQIICTSAFGMGLDLPNVGLVIHWQHPASAEDLLQEFGRAGRDGQPAVAVVLHGDGGNRDKERLEFMAKLTVEASSLPEDEQAEMLAARMRRIQQVESMMDEKLCYRHAIMTYFGSDGIAKRPSLAMRIIEFIFGSRQLHRKFTACCDHCDSKKIKGGDVVEYANRILGSVRSA